MQTQPQTQPPITLTRVDLERLSELLNEPEGKVRHLLVERLAEELHRAQVVSPSHAKGVVTLGSRVLYENLESGQRREVTVVLPSEAEAGTNRLSVLTPVGCSLIGLKQGDTFTWDDENHRWRLLVVSVKHPD